MTELERLRAENSRVREALKHAWSHLEWCGYGDAYERECAMAARLPEIIEDALMGSVQEQAKAMWDEGRTPGPDTNPQVTAVYDAMLDLSAAQTDSATGKQKRLPKEP